MKSFPKLFQEKQQKEEDAKMKAMQEEAEKKIKMINGVADKVMELLEEEDMLVENTTMCLQACLKRMQTKGNMVIQPEVDKLNKMKLSELPELPK